MNKGGLGARSLNLELQRRLNPNPARKIERFGTTLATGDKVIQTVNNYDKDVFNGDIGTVQEVDPVDGVLEIAYDGRRVLYDTVDLDEIALAYAITIHKSQGSEYPAVVLPVSTQHYVMLQRNLLYTGLTRGRKLVVLIGQKRAVATAVRNINTVKRLTALRHRLARGVA
jgi:exodeoxyribonuclease V alpha subunit